MDVYLSGQSPSIDGFYILKIGEEYSLVKLTDKKFIQISGQIVNINSLDSALWSEKIRIIESKPFKLKKIEELPFKDSAWFKKWEEIARNRETQH